MTQQRIDGERVYVISGASNSGGHKTYHTHPNCTSAEMRKVGLDQLSSSYHKCEYCRYKDGDREEAPSGNGEAEEMTCPICGETTDIGARHIRHCTGGDE